MTKRNVSSLPEELPAVHNSLLFIRNFGTRVRNFKSRFRWSSAARVCVCVNDWGLVDRTGATESAPSRPEEEKHVPEVCGVFNSIVSSLRLLMLLMMMVWWVMMVEHGEVGPDLLSSPS